MRISRASDQAQRRTLLDLLNIAFSFLYDGDDFIHAADLELSTIVGSPDLADLVIYVRGITVETKRLEPEIHQLRLRSMPYREYLNTPEWAERRTEQLMADGHRCRICNAADRLQVHHRTYANRGNEQPGDLITLCGDCHRSFHRSRELSRATA